MTGTGLPIPPLLPGRPLLLILVVVLALALLTACGSSDDAASGNHQPGGVEASAHDMDQNSDQSSAGAADVQRGQSDSRIPAGDQAPDRPAATESTVGGIVMEALAPGTLAVVNGESITLDMLELHLSRRSGGHVERLSADDRETLLLELVEMELIAQDARNHAMHADTRVKAQMSNVNRAVLAQTRIERLRQEPVAEMELRTMYDKRYTHQPHQELHARHILVNSEKHARQVIRALDSGGDFISLAREHSQGPLAEDGGDLGWFTADQMVDSFAEAALALPTGKHSREPVATEYGWHVIHMDARRDAEPPDYELVREDLRQRVLAERIRDYLLDLRQDSNVMLIRDSGRARH